MRIILLLAIALFVLLVLTYPFKLKTAVHINFLEDVGFGAVKFLNLKLFCARFKITKNGKFEIHNAVKKKKKKKNKTIRKKYFLCLASLLKIKKFEVMLDAGYEDNAYLLSMFCGYFSNLSSSLIAVLMNKYKGIKVFYRVNPFFKQNRLELSGSIVVSFSLLDMIVAIFCSYFCFMKSKIKEKIHG